jgi:hypothetical protein
MVIMLSTGVALNAVLAPRSVGQVRGIVQTTMGASLADVSVELWDSSSVIARQRTKADGSFSFAGVKTPQNLSVSARRLGYRPRVISTTGTDGLMRVQLEAVPPDLPAVLVADKRDRCTDPREDTVATKAIRRLALRYLPWPTGRGVTARTFVSRGVVPGTELDSALSTPVLSHAGYLSWSDYGYARALSKPQREGYAVRVDMHDGQFSTVTPTFFAWHYAELFTGAFEHFTTPFFVTHHVFDTVRDLGGELTVAFCPRDTKKPTIEGILTIGSDGALRAAQWSYRTDRPNEGAEGTIEYRDMVGAGGIRIAPIAAAFWRKTPPTSHWYFEHWRYTAWAIGIDGQLPDVPPEPREAQNGSH